VSGDQRVTEGGDGRPPAAHVEFCGEVYDLDPERPFSIGREGDLEVDSNPFLHRRFLELHHADGVWWLANVGSQLAATVSAADGTINAWIGPGARLPLVLPRAAVWFTAGPTTYELEIVVDGAAFGTTPPPPPPASDLAATVDPLQPSAEQRLLLLALAEPALRRGQGSSTSEIPSSADAARRLGWTLTKFNRKLDALCEKLGRHGVRGLHGGPDQLASNRRARLVEYALSTRIVSREELSQLDTRPEVPADGDRTA
jgi:hypothetical protein